jgi:Ser/Thr protein kinase RdoA (MazF antagonist)
MGDVEPTDATFSSLGTLLGQLDRALLQFPTALARGVNEGLPWDLLQTPLARDRLAACSDEEKARS